MKTITDENGQVYVLKEDMEGLIKERVSKVAAKAREFEMQLSEANDRLETLTKETASVDILTGKIQELQDQLKRSNNSFDRYKAISKHGLVDDDIIEAIEWAYERTMAKTSDKERVDLGQWLENQVSDIENSHPVLRPHLRRESIENTTSDIETSINDDEEAQVQTEVNNGNYASVSREIPRVNTGAKKPPETRNIIDQGLRDRDFYKANREAIIDAYKKLQQGRG